MGYQRAISNIKAYSKPIKDANQMNDIPFVGDGIKKKVAEFLEQGRMTKLENLKSDSKLQILETLSQIWGVGPAAASKLYASGIRSIEQLRKNDDDLLTYGQKAGLKYYEDFLQKIPRDEVTVISETV